MIRLFEIDNGVLKETEHCHSILWLKKIRDNYPQNYLKIYEYLFYMSCMSQENPYFNLEENVKEETILDDIGADFSTEDDLIRDALTKTQKMYETVTVRAYNNICIMLDNLGDYMRTTKIKDGRDGNVNSLIRAGKEYDNLRKSFKGIAKDLEAEQQTLVRGAQQLSYDQNQ